MTVRRERRRYVQVLDESYFGFCLQHPEAIASRITHGKFSAGEAKSKM
jgi:hypothetical protein